MSEAPEALWLIFAKGPQPPGILNMVRARSGLWWRKVACESDALAYVRRLRTAGLDSWHKYEADMIPRETRAQKRAREQDFRVYQRDSKPVPKSPVIALDPNRDRSSGRRTYAEYRETDLAPGRKWEPNRL